MLAFATSTPFPSSLPVLFPPLAGALVAVAGNDPKADKIVGALVANIWKDYTASSSGTHINPATQASGRANMEVSALDQASSP